MAHSDLIARLEKAESGSNDLSATMCVAVGYAGANSDGAVNIRTDEDWDGDLLFEIGSEECCNPIPKLTTSIDAIVALIGEKIGGGYRIDASDGPLGLVEAWIWRKDSPGGAFHGEGWSAPLALCSALLRALDTEGGEP